MSGSGGGGNIAQIRAALQQLQAYELPAKYGEIGGGGDGDGENAHPNLDTDLTEPLDGTSPSQQKRTGADALALALALAPGLDREAILRYKAARNTYLRQRTAQLFLEHLQTFDGENFNFPQQILTEEAEADLRRREEEARSDLAAISRGAEERLDRVRAKYQALVARREELARTVAEMEQAGDLLAANDDVHDDDITEEMGGPSGDLGGGGGGLTLGQLSQNSAGSADADADIDADIDANIDDEQMAAQEERLASLIERKAELEARLRRLKTQRALVDADVVHNRRVVTELRGRNSTGGGGGSGQEMNGDDLEEDEDDEEMLDEIQDPAAFIEQIEERTAATLRAAAEMRDAADWYDGMREAIEELGGMRILGIEQVHEAANARPSAIVVKFELLDEHHLEVQLSSEIVAGRRTVANRKAGGAGEVLRVASAKITTDTTVASSRPPATSTGEDGASGTDRGTGAATVEVRIRQPTDLVALAANLAPVDDLRFVVRETQARIRSATLRSEELAILRGSYLTRIGPAPRDTEEQEVVCSLSQGITVVLRLCGDCPLTEGSVYICDIVGVGGWKQSDLDDVKKAVSRNAFASPVALMDSLKQEIQRVTTHGMRGEEEDKTIELPKTPVLPTRR
mmetsp:Transcript_11400/g.32277  ORF Transcript_11400/g.32277 Transcript_11400/m.32277 type:complete len:631 (+) Transcript_11400:106-1998(+)